MSTTGAKEVEENPISLCSPGQAARMLERAAFLEVRGWICLRLPVPSWPPGALNGPAQSPGPEQYLMEPEWPLSE